MSTVEIREHSSEVLGSHWQALGDPDERLRGMVGRYCAYREHTHEGFGRWELPWPSVVLILSFGPPIEVGTAPDHSTLRSYTSFIGPINEVPALTAHHGVQDGIQVDLSPIAASMLVGMPLQELGLDMVLPLEDVLGPEFTFLMERLDADRTPEHQFAELDAWFLERLYAAPHPHAGVVQAWKRLRETNGQIPVATLADELGWSRRRLVERFKPVVGLPPKTIARIMRFHEAIGRLGHDDLASIALDCGYYDQAHFNNDVRAFTGATPGELIARRMPDGFGISSDADLTASVL